MRKQNFRLKSFKPFCFLEQRRMAVKFLSRVWKFWKVESRWCILYACVFREVCFIPTNVIEFCVKKWNRALHSAVQIKNNVTHYIWKIKSLFQWLKITSNTQNVRFSDWNFLMNYNEVNDWIGSLRVPWFENIRWNSSTASLRVWAS